MTRPLVIAHRGASGYRPEHTLAAYALAIEQGADFIEPDLVATRDGQLVARHENELSGSTDVAARPEFADRRCRKRIDGVEREGWFSEDFLLEEIRSLRARERVPALRPANVAYDGRFAVPSFPEILALVRQAEAAGRCVGVYPETKHPTWFASEGSHRDGAPIHQSLGALLLRDLVAAGLADPARVFIQSFEIANLVELQQVLMPAQGLALPLVQLLAPLRDDAGLPHDLGWHRARGDDLDAIYGALAPTLAGVRGSADLVAPAALRALRGSHARALGIAKDSLLPQGAAAAPHPCLAEVLAAGLELHPYTLRAELGAAAELPRLLELGVHGFFIDQPDLGVALRDQHLARVR